jgi:hypothetical protein
MMVRGLIERDQAGGGRREHGTDWWHRDWPHGNARKRLASDTDPHHGSGPHGDAAHLRDHQEPGGLLMAETIQLGEVSIAVTRKDIKNVHLSVGVPRGHTPDLA